MSHAHRVVGALAAFLAAGAVGVGVPTPAGADPATPVVHRSASSATRIDGFVVDTCAAPPLSTVTAWSDSSPYVGVNVYFGGRNRACPQPNLSVAWVREVTTVGWSLLPTYVGDQPFCTTGSKPYRYSAAGAAARGSADGADAVARARALGLRYGSALYADVEPYDRGVASCTGAVRRYVSEWTRALHGAGYLAGVYVHQDSGLLDLAGSYLSTSLARPDAVWMARWDGVPTLTGWPTAGDTLWAEWQRAKQYRGDHPETWGGMSLEVDTDVVRAPVATVSRTYSVTRTRPLYVRSGPTTTAPITGVKQPGSPVVVLCQADGQRIGTSPVWDRTGTGGYVTDYYVSTPSQNGFSAAIPRCSYPGQITTSGPVNTRAGPGTSYRNLGLPLQGGALAPVACQRAGSLVGTTRVWDRLVDGRWVTDYYVSNRSNTTYSTPVPRCP